LAEWIKEKQKQCGTVDMLSGAFEQPEHPEGAPQQISHVSISAFPFCGLL
jgi:hypothetical protein